MNRDEVTVLEKACQLIPATPEILLQWMTHIDEVTDDTFAIICCLVDAGYEPFQVKILNQLTILLGAENIVEQAKSLVGINFEDFVFTLNKLNLDMQYSVMLVCITKNIELFDRVKSIQSDNTR